MAEGSDLASMSMLEKVTLLAITDLTFSAETPAYPYEVRSATEDCIEPLADEVIGMPDEASVSRALNALEADGYLELVETEDPSPVGKGRPCYSLQDDPDVVLSELATDDRIGDAIQQVQTDHAD